MIRAYGLVFRYVCRVRVWVRVGKRKIIEVLRLSPIVFRGYNYSRTTAFCCYLTSTHATHKKVIAILDSFTLRSKINDK